MRDFGVLDRECVTSRNGEFRYWLRRKVRQPYENPKHNYAGVLWIMLNPSKARAEVRDPTDRKCEGFTQRLGGSEYGIVNLFGYSATKPTNLFDWGIEDAVGPENDLYLETAAEYARRNQWLIMCAWGRPSLPKRQVEAVRQRSGVVSGLIGSRVHCLMTTDEGFPRHPLYVSYSGDYPYPY